MIEKIFDINHKDEKSKARNGVLHLPHGDVQTPVFMPVGTKGTVKALTKDDLEEIGFEIILANTYHMYLRPGADIVDEGGGLHGFTKWNRNFLTDSGGFQVWSLSKLRKIKEEGVEFRSDIDGSKHGINDEFWGYDFVLGNLHNFGDRNTLHGTLGRRHETDTQTYQYQDSLHLFISVFSFILSNNSRPTTNFTELRGTNIQGSPVFTFRTGRAVCLRIRNVPKSRKVTISSLCKLSVIQSRNIFTTG